MKNPFQLGVYSKR